jgi:hypothetical protein
MSAQVIATICISLWASFLWVSLPKALKLQKKFQGLPALKLPLNAYFQPRFVAKAAAVAAALIKLKF